MPRYVQLPDCDGFPDNGRVSEALEQLLYVRGNRPLRAQEAYKFLAEKFELDWKQLSLKTATRDDPKWHNICRTARNHLVKQGRMKQLPRNSWALTDKVFRGKSMTLEELGL